MFIILGQGPFIMNTLEMKKTLWVIAMLFCLFGMTIIIKKWTRINKKYITKLLLIDQLESPAGWFEGIFVGMLRDLKSNKMVQLLVLKGT